MHPLPLPLQPQLPLPLPLLQQQLQQQQQRRQHLHVVLPNGPLIVGAMMKTIMQVATMMEELVVDQTWTLHSVQNANARTPMHPLPLPPRQLQLRLPYLACSHFGLLTAGVMMKITHQNATMMVELVARRLPHQPLTLHSALSVLVWTQMHPSSRCDQAMYTS